MNKFTAIALISAASAVQVDREPLLTWAPTPPASHPVDYFVPDFGMDHEIKASMEHEKQAAETLKHKWNPEVDPADGRYVVPTETASFQLLQTDAKLRREPLLTWAPTPPASHPIDYFVPNFGVDHDILATQEHEAAASKELGHQWNPAIDPVDGRYVVPTESAFFKL